MFRSFLLVVIVVSAAVVPAASATIGDIGSMVENTAGPQRSERRFVGRCLLQVGKKKVLSGKCGIVMMDDGSFLIYEQNGSFDINTLEGKLGYFAQVNVDPNGTEGYWNGQRGGLHAHSRLGKLTRDGACWKNRRAKVCAWE